mgnify:CR=1 FL=1
MKKEKTKVYIYTRVSTAMQIDGYSLDAQKSRMKAFAEYNEYEIVGEYEDAGKSGKSIEGRAEFNRMMEDFENQDYLTIITPRNLLDGLARFLQHSPSRPAEFNEAVKAARWIVSRWLV